MLSGRIVWSRKKLFRILTFSSSSVYTIPLRSRGGTEDLELGEINVLRIDHNFWKRVGQTSVCLRFCLCELVLILELKKPLCCATF